MSKFEKFCINSLKLVIGIALILILKSSIDKLNFNNDPSFMIHFFYLILTMLVLGLVIINTNLSGKIKILILLLMALGIRIAWIVNVDSIPVSDFNTMYLAAKDLINGNLTEFRGFGYLSRFPHLVCTTLYMALMIILFPTTHLFAMKIVNAILSVLIVFLLYRLSKNFVKHEKVRLIVMLISAVFPPFIAYSSTYCTENIAIPIYLFTMILFFNAIETKNLGKFLLTGILLSISNLFRGVGIIFLIAFFIYIFIFEKEDKLKRVSLILGGMLVTSFFVSLFLMSVNIIDKPLSKGAEPSFATLLLKGTNIENGGRWNLEDAMFVEENLGNPNLVKECIDISIKRISSLSGIQKYEFFKEKFLSQWSVGDFSGTFWAFLDTDLKLDKIVPGRFQIIFICIIIISFIGVFSLNKRKESALIYTLLVGFGLMFMIIETQSRYSYIISWAFLILFIQGIENLLNVIRRVKNVKSFFNARKV